MRAPVPWALAGLAFGAFVGSLSAQASHARGAFVGPFLGFVGTGMPDYQWDYRADFSVGVQWDQLFQNVFVRLGAFYTGRGAQLTPVGGDGTLKERYVEFPLLLGYRPPAGRIRVFMMAGAQMGFQTSCTSEGVMDGVSYTSDCHKSSLEQIFDYGVLVGGGLSLPVGRANLTLDLRVMKGLYEDPFYDRKNQSVTVGAAYMFPLAHHP